MLIPFVSLIVSFGLLLTSGLVVQRLLDRRYFRPDGATGTLGSLADRTVEHTFCSTDLVLGQPVYFSSWGGGSAWRRTARTGGAPSGLRYGADNLALAEVVRASSAFPGIPPLASASSSPAPCGPSRAATGTAPARCSWPTVGSGTTSAATCSARTAWSAARKGQGRAMVLLCVNSSAAARRRYRSASRTDR